MGNANQYSFRVLFVVSIFVVGLLTPLLTPALTAFAAGETLSNVADVTGRPGKDTAITGLQVGGTGDDEVSVSLYVPSGELWFDDYGNVSFEGYNQGTNIKMNGTRSEVNYALSNLMYVGDDEGTVKVEVLLGGGDYNSENKHVYKVVADSGITWDDARQAAEEMEYGGVNGYLATITSPEEDAFISERIDNSGWIGASDDEVEDEWRWVTGPEGAMDGGDGLLFWEGTENGTLVPEQHANWSPGEPNNNNVDDDSEGDGEGGGIEDGEDCGQIWFTEGSNGQWNDLDCEGDGNEYYVVEFGGTTPESLPEIESTTFDITIAREITQIDSCDELFDLDEEYAANTIELTADIDCNGRTEGPLFYDEEQDEYEDFTGIFQGNGFTIKNLIIANDDSSHVGLTGYSEGAEYHNLFLDTISLEGGFHNGVLAGHVQDSIIAENIHATNITMTAARGDDAYIEEMGVLFGTVGVSSEYGESNIEHVSVQGTFDVSDVESVSGVGGLIGSLYSEGNLTIKQAYADVDIIANNVSNETNSVGGLIGSFEADVYDEQDVVAGIHDSYTWGSITAPDGSDVGGLIGYVANSSNGDADTTFSVENSYSWMDVTADSDVGGLIGYVSEIDYEDGTYGYELRNSFYAGTLDGNQDTGIIIGSYTDYEEEYSTLTFDNVWYDANKIDDYDCVSNMSVDECNAANSDGSQPNYFINNKTSAPMDEWNFDTIWRTNAGTPPVFKPFAGNDGDQDGINNYIESRAPNNGDGNNDGIADSEQSHVASLKNSGDGKYVTLVVDDVCALEDVNVKAEVTKPVQDSGYDYPGGLVRFGADCGTPGYTTNVKLYFYGLDSNLVVRKYNPNTNAYFTITSATKAPQTIGGQAVTVVSYQITDGGTLDVDNTVNGTIVDPVGLGLIGVGSPKTGL